MEEVSVAMYCSLVLGVIGTYWAWKVVNWVWLRPKRLERLLRKQGFQGNPYRFLIGDMRDAWRVHNEAKAKPIGLDDDILSRAAPIVSETLKKYGKRSFIWIGPTPRLTIMDPDELKELFTKLNDFPKPPMSPIIKSLVSGLAIYEGDKWVKHRRILTPAFQVEKLKLMIPTFHISFGEILSKWENLANTGHGSCELDVWPDILSCISDAIARTSFGSSYKEGKRTIEIQRELAKIVMECLLSIGIPGYSYLPTEANRRMRKMKKELDGLLGELVSKRKKAMLSGATNNDDLLGLLLESNEREIRESGNTKSVGMSFQEVVDECKLFYFAGHDNTTAWLSWTIVMLCRFPDWQARAREEVIKTFGHKNPDYDGLTRLKVVTMILNEVLRVYPPVITQGRETFRKETKLGNLTLPAGVQVTMPAILVHYDTDLWGEDAKEFKPERFEEGISKATKGKSTCYFPFSWGTRACIGQNYAMLELKIAVAMILQRFSLELSPSYTHAPTSVLVLEPQHGVHVILRKAF